MLWPLKAFDGESTTIKMGSNITTLASKALIIKFVGISACRGFSSAFARTGRPRDIDLKLSS